VRLPSCKSRRKNKHSLRRAEGAEARSQCCAGCNSDWNWKEREAAPSHIEQRTKEPAKRANRNPKPNQPRCGRTQQIGIERCAPESGIILKLDRNSQVVRPGEAIAQIAPSNAPLVVKARVEAQNIDKVKKSQMQVSACPYPDYGTVKNSCRDAPHRQARSIRRTPSYEVIIQPQTRFVGNEDRQCRLQSGMEGRADISRRQYSSSFSERQGY